VQNLEVNPLFTDTLVDEGTPLQLGANPVGGNGQFSYTWGPPNYLNSATNPRPISIPYTDIVYTLSITSGPCVDSSQINVRVHIFPDIIVIPNAFTPNGDGNNDYFEVYGDKGAWKQFQIMIFDRSGEKVFESRVSNFKWDGTYKGKLLNPAVFVYLVT